MKQARFAVTHCSQCGGSFGPGDAGFSHCSQHSSGVGLLAANAPTQRGGKRDGAGRKALPPDEATKPRSVRLNNARWDKLKRLGTDWLARQIDRAKE